jgi:hypothetical protein
LKRSAALQLETTSPKLRILEQHKRLRTRIAAVHELAFEVRAGRGSAGALKSAVGLLVLTLADHMADEERILCGPGGWSPERLKELSYEHVVQRRMLEDFINDASNEFRAESLARIALGLIEELLHDMKSEEAELQ